MDVVMDGLLIAATLFAGAYCWVLAGRVRALKSLEGGLGGAIVTLTRQIELARATLDEARAGSRETRQDLGQLIARSDAAAAQLRLLLAATEQTAPQAPPAPREETSPTGQPPVLAAAPTGGVLARRRESPGPRLVPPPEPEPKPEPEPAPEAAALPKPRRTLSLDGLLRRRPAPEEPPAGRAANSEAELIAALTALAAGGER